MIPAMLNNGGIKVAAQWTKLLNDNGYEAKLASTHGDKCKDFWNFTVPTCSFAEVEDRPGNVVVWNWGPDLVKRKFQHVEEFYYAQDCCQPHYPENQTYMPILKEKKLITIGHHSKWFYEYTQGMKVVGVVNNFVDQEVFKFDSLKASGPESTNICMMEHREHWNPNIIPKLKEAGFNVVVAKGTQAQVAEAMRKSQYFVSFAPGVETPHGHVEGFPLPTAEAMAAGCITIAMDNCGNTEYLMDKINGFFHKGEDDVLRIINSLKHDLFNRMRISEAASRTFRYRFNKENTFEQIKEALGL
jgi:hypothetical protein